MVTGAIRGCSPYALALKPISFTQTPTGSKKAVGSLTTFSQVFWVISVVFAMSSTEGSDSLRPLTRRTESGTHRALEIEYKEMANWYDRFWMDYLNKTLPKPLGLLATHVTASKASRTTVVDVGCGTGVLLKRFADGYRSSNTQLPKLIGIEPSAAMAENAKAKFVHETKSVAEFKFAPAEDLPLQDQSVDVVCSTSAFHFFFNKEKALGEMKRVLKKGGKLIITDWCADYLLVKLYNWFERVRWFRHEYPRPIGTKQMLDMVQEAGFDDVSVERYTVRFWFCVWWGMQTVTAKKTDGA